MKKIFFILLAGICFSNVYSQDTDGDGAGLNREILLEREYNPTILDAVKISRLPGLHEPQTSSSKVEFSDYATPFGFIPSPSYMKQLLWLQDLHVSKYRGYITGGLSNLFDVDANAGYQVFNNSTDYLDFYLLHGSSNSKRTFLQGKDLSQKFRIADVTGGMNYRHSFSKTQLNLDAKYTYSTYNFSQLRKEIVFDPNLYSTFATQAGYMTDSAYSFTPKNNLFEAGAGVSSIKPDNFSYYVNLRYSFFGQNRDLKNSVPLINENRIVLDWNLRKTVSSSSALGLSGSFRNLLYFLSNEFAYANNDLRKFSVVLLNPYYYIEGDDFNLKLGVVFDFEYVWFRGNIMAPAVEFNWNLREKVHLYAMTEGGHQDNSKYGMFYENRYASAIHRIRDSRSPLDATLGLKLLPLPELKINLFTGYKIIEDEHYFIQHNYIPDIYHYYSETMYNDEFRFKTGGEIKYMFADNFEFDLKAIYYKRKLRYNAENNLIPSQKPKMEASANIGYKLHGLPLRFDFSYRGFYGRRANECFEIPNGLFFEQVKMKDIHDASLKSTYTFKPNFSAYLTINNLLFQQYEIWYGYPVQTFNIMAGVSFMF
ncbi:MAG: hypothetical protein LBC68_07320 [Prevotellaceae bacterium]|jgi:hypothetical protein|nr:hypothetical protein [Prevotellaceae bacterium]